MGCCRKPFRYLNSNYGRGTRVILDGINSYLYILYGYSVRVQTGIQVKDFLLSFLRSLLDSLRDLLPIILVISFFQLVILQQPIPNLAEILYGTFLVVLGLTLFVQGLEMGLFPIGETMAYAFARKGSLFWLLAFAFSLGFGTTVAEPAISVCTRRWGGSSGLCQRSLALACANR